MRALRVPEALEVSVVTEEGERGRVKADAVVAEFADEVLLNDKTISGARQGRRGSRRVRGRSPAQRQDHKRPEDRARGPRRGAVEV